MIKPSLRDYFFKENTPTNKNNLKNFPESIISDYILDNKRWHLNSNKKNLISDDYDTYPINNPMDNENSMYYVNEISTAKINIEFGDNIDMSIYKNKYNITDTYTSNDP